MNGPFAKDVNVVNVERGTDSQCIRRFKFASTSTSVVATLHQLWDGDGVAQQAT